MLSSEASPYSWDGVWTLVVGQCKVQNVLMGLVRCCCLWKEQGNVRNIVRRKLELLMEVRRADDLSSKI